MLGLVLAESLLIAAVGGAMGLWLAHALTQQDITSGLILLYLPPIALAGARPSRWYRAARRACCRRSARCG